MPNVALIKHDGAPLNVPAGNVRAIFPMAPMEEAPDMKSVLVTSLRGGTNFWLQDSPEDVFESTMKQLPAKLQEGAAAAWIKLQAPEKTPKEGAEVQEKQDPTFIHIHCDLIDGYDGVKDAATDKPVLRIWINNRTNMEFTELCADLPENRAALDKAVLWREQQGN